MLQSTLPSQRVINEEMRAAIRNRGISQMSEVEAVVLETDGSLRILLTEPATTVLNDVNNYPSSSV